MVAEVQVGDSKHDKNSFLSFATGNKVTKDEAAKSPALPPQTTTPTLTSKNYTTGRGGQGNIVSNDDPTTARVAQDVDVPGITLPENDVHVGRGE